MTNKDLTVIITTFKSEDKIENCLNSIDSNVKIIVVENSNNKKFQNYIENRYKNAECILTKENLGYGRANNIALKKVKTRYSLILNPDTILSKNSLNNFFSFAEVVKNFAIVAPDQNELEVKNNKLKEPRTKEVEQVKGFAMFLNMEKFSKIGFFDENFFLYLEEIDLCKRIKKINEKIYIEPKIKVFHHGGSSVNKIFFEEIELTRNWHWMWSLFYFNKKHHNFLSALILVFPKLTSSLLKIIFYSFYSKSKKKDIYKKRLSGLTNSIFGKSSWYRPTLD
jgi:N-acetylglucosaminyl-diphospho-decaprenol L-rhamnosyltransferase|tara:strand:+ start:5606 stop:6448 length:843 start_codon:yes stop_codon:yes gene_type:complete